MELRTASRLRDAVVILRAVRPFLAAPLIGGLALPVGWPYWQEHLPVGLAVLLMGSTLAAAGILLSLGTGSRTTGWLLVCAAVLGQLSWVSTRDTGALPVIGEFLLSSSFFVLIAALLYRRRPRLQFREERILLAAAFVILIVLQLLCVPLLKPSDMGYSPDAHWPHLNLGQNFVDGFLAALESSYGALAVGFILTLRLQQRRLPGLARRRDLWLAAGGGLWFLTAVVMQYPIMSAADFTMSTLVTIRALQFGAVTLVPLGLFASALVDTWEHLTTVARLQAGIGVISPLSVEDALRSVLRDPGLRLWLWVEAKECYVNADGRVRRPDAGVGPGRVSHHVAGPEAGRLAVLDLDRRLLARPGLLDAATTAGVHALLVLQLQVRSLEQLRELQARLLETQERASRELARNLHDGVQQDLAALEIEVVRLRRMPPGVALERQIDTCRQRVRDINEEVRRIARGLHPPALLERGLVGALEDDAERLGRVVVFDVQPGRLAPRAEIALYYVLSEALLNVHKHARASKAVVSVTGESGVLVARVVDDGIGGAVLRLGGGLHGADDRIRSLRGELTIASEPGCGTELTVTLPLDEVRP